jgi:ABC-type lipoprotein release transport system permease subunit
VTGLAASGLPPTALIGVRNALQRRASGTNIPVGTAYLGTALAVVALCGTAVFGSSLSHLTATPALYGDPYQLVVPVIPGVPEPALLKSLNENKGVEVITRALVGQVSINKTTVGLLAVESQRGPLELSIIDGHLPGADGEIALGAATMRQVGAHVGSVIHVTVSTPSGGMSTEPFRVVARMPLPVVGGYVGLGNGALLTIPGYQAAACPAGTRNEGACRQAVLQSNFGAVVTKVASGSAGRMVVNHYLTAYPLFAELPVVPTSLINFGEAVNFPLIFGGIVAIFGAATISHLLVVSVARRRREIGLLKMLGFTNRQVISSVAWQVTTLTLVGLVIGLPLGIVAGRAVWDLFASELGVVPVAVVSPGIIALLAAGVLVTANLLAIGPAYAATRTKAGRLLAGHRLDG